MKCLRGFLLPPPRFFENPLFFLFPDCSLISVLNPGAVGFWFFYWSVVVFGPGTHVFPVPLFSLLVLFPDAFCFFVSCSFANACSGQASRPPLKTGVLPISFCTPFWRYSCAHFFFLWLGAVLHYVPIPLLPREEWEFSPGRLECLKWSLFPFVKFQFFRPSCSRWKTRLEDGDIGCVVVYSFHVYDLCLKVSLFPPNESFFFGFWPRLETFLMVSLFAIFFFYYSPSKCGRLSLV